MYNLFTEYFCLEAAKRFICEIDTDSDGYEEPVSNIDNDFAESCFVDFCNLLNIDETDDDYKELKDKFTANRDQLVESFNNAAIEDALRGGNDYEPQF